MLNLAPAVLPSTAAGQHLQYYLVLQRGLQYYSITYT